MRAGYYTGNFTYEVRDIPEPEPQGREVKIRVAWCGLCGTDVHRFHGRDGAHAVKLPLILGHEASGTVVACGPDVKYLKVGDRVACDPNGCCGQCAWCKRGLPQFCQEHKNVCRAFVDYVCTPESNVYRLPDGLDLEDAAFAEPLSCAVHGLDQLHMESGRTVAIFGMGSIGSLMLQIVLLQGPSKVIVVEREENKRAIALELGADVAVDAAQIEAIAEQENIDYVIECIGLNATMEQALRVAGLGAKVLFFGLGDPERPMSFNQYEAFAKELSIFTSYLNPHTTGRAVELLASGRMDVRRIVSAEIDLEDMGEELKSLANARAGKVMVRLSGEH